MIKATQVILGTTKDPSNAKFSQFDPDELWICHNERTECVRLTKPGGLMCSAGQPGDLQTIIDRVRGMERVLARQMAADEQAEISSMPAEIREVELPFTARNYYALALTALAERRALTDSELDGVRARGTQRALEGFPLHLFLHNWTRGASILWDACAAQARPGEEAGLRTIASALFAITDQAIAAGSEAYASARSAIGAHDRGDAQIVARLLLDGQDPSAVAEQAGIELAIGYDVLALDLAPTTEELTEQAAASGVAARRKILRILSALHRAGLGEALVVLDPRSAQVLVPRSPEAEAETELDEARCRGVYDVIARAAGGPVAATGSPARVRADIPGAAEDAAEMLRVALASGLGPGFHRVNDMALQVQLSRPGAARDHLLSVLDLLDTQPGLTDTVAKLLALDGDRGRTARALGVHPNTINNRLAKCQQLLGFDPTSTRGIVTLSAALAARQVGSADAD